jgi:GNAT superfamily N-acetyltransferase
MICIMPKSSIHIKLVATPDKLTREITDTLRGLQQRCFPYDPYYKPKGCWWWIAYDGKKPVAFVGLTPYEDNGWIPRVGVIPNYRGHHLQRRLYRIVFNHARRLEMKRVVTYTHRYNFESAINMLKVGMCFYRPSYEWGCDGALYFEKKF